jgi:hypothetical protein
VIPDEAVEAAALGIHTRGGVSVPEAREYARAALEFAAPHLISNRPSEEMIGAAYEVKPLEAVMTRTTQDEREKAWT